MRIKIIFGIYLKHMQMIFFFKNIKYSFSLEVVYSIIVLVTFRILPRKKNQHIQSSYS